MYQYVHVHVHVRIMVEAYRKEVNWETSQISRGVAQMYGATFTVTTEQDNQHKLQISLCNYTQTTQDTQLYSSHISLSLSLSPSLPPSLPLSLSLPSPVC